MVSSVRGWNPHRLHTTIVYSIGNLDLVTIGIQSRGTLQHDLQNLHRGGQSDLEAILDPFLAWSTKHIDLVLAVGSNHGLAVKGDIAFGAPNAFTVSVDGDFDARRVAEVAAEKVDIDILCVDSIVFLCVILVERPVRRETSLW